MASILVSGTNGIVVSAGVGDTIILRNLRINGINGTVTGGLNGVRFLAGKQLVVENCDVFGFTQNGIDVSLNQASDANVAIHNTNLTNIGQSAVSFVTMTASNVFGSLSNVAIRATGSGVTVGSPGAAGVFVDVSNSTVAQTTGFGLHAVLGSISAENNMFTGNGTAVRAESGGTIRLSNNGIYNNVVGVKAVGAIPSAANNRNAGNTTPGAPNGSITIQ